MSDAAASPQTGSPDAIFAAPRRSNWVRLRTLILLRWIAIAGQVTAVLVGEFLLDLVSHNGLIALAISAAIITNVAAAIVFPENQRVSEGGLVCVLVFDMAQLSTLLMLTGGLNNPFASLILAQVAISAAVLRLRAMVAVCTVALLLTTVNLFFYIPLQNKAGAILEIEPIFRVGFWAAIMTGVIFQASYARRVTLEMTAMADALSATQMALAREQKLTDLGGVVAAAAHELGTPLATIALVSGEMMEEAPPGSEQEEDARLIRDQAERCRVILHSMGRAGKQDQHMRQAPLSSLLEEAAAPHGDRGIALLYDLAAAGRATIPEPVILRRPEIVHGIRNLVQNAVDYAVSTVWIDARWTETRINLRIADDGPGYPSDLLPYLGDPFTRNRRKVERRKREGYEGMGLGLFIAKTLLERSGAELTFANADERTGPPGSAGRRCGAFVTLSWERATLERPGGDRRALGENAPTAL